MGASLALSSCGGADVRPEDLPTGDILKVSYYRVNLEARTRRPEPTYRVVLSDSWKLTFGESPRETLSAAAPNQVYKGFAKDSEVRRFIDKLRDLGLFSLNSRNTDDVNPKEVYTKALDPKEKDFTRVITVGNDKAAKSYFYRDQQVSKDMIETFDACEMYLSKVMPGYTINVKVVTDPRDK